MYTVSRNGNWGPINPNHPGDRCACSECSWARLTPIIKETKKSWPEPEWDWEDLAEQDRKSRQRKT